MPSLTNAAIRDLAPGGILYDDVVDGLHVRRGQGDKRTFYLYFRTRDGIERRPKLDHWGNITIAQAREAARALRAQIAAGVDPMAERAKAKANPTVAEFFEVVFREHWSKRASRAEVRRLYDRHVAPGLGGHRVQAVCHGDVRRVHVSLQDTPYQANRVLSLLTRLFNLAARPDYGFRVPGDNPCDGAERFAELKRARKAEPHELARIGPILEREAATHPRSVAYLYVLAFSGARPTEISRAGWDQLTRMEIGGKPFGILAIDRGKTGQIQVVLPPPAMAIIDRLPVVEGQTIFGIQSPRTLWRRVRAEAGCPDLRMRDWRRTFASVGLSNGAAAGVVGELLNHASAQTTKTYARLYAPQARETAAATAAAVQRLLTGQ